MFLLIFAVEEDESETQRSCRQKNRQCLLFKSRSLFVCECDAETVV